MFWPRLQRNLTFRFKLNLLGVLSLRQTESKKIKKNNDGCGIEICYAQNVSLIKFHYSAVKTFSVKKDRAVNECGNHEQSNSQIWKHILTKNSVFCRQIFSLGPRFMLVSRGLKKNISDHHNAIPIDKFFSKTKTANKSW